MAIDLNQSLTPPAETPPPITPAPEAATPEPTPMPTETPPAETAPKTPETTESTKQPEPDTATRLTALEKQYQETQQERDYYKGSYEQTIQQRQEQEEQAADLAFDNELRQTYGTRLQQLEQDSPEYKALLKEAWIVKRSYDLDKSERRLASNQQNLLRHQAELGRDQFYQAASVTHHIPLARLRQLVPRTDNINPIDIAANSWRQGYNEATRALSAQNRIATGVDNVPTGAGVGGQGYATMEDIEEAHARGDISTAQKLEIVEKRKLKYRDGSSPV